MLSPCNYDWTERRVWGGDYHNDYEIAYHVHKVAFLQHLTNKQQLFSVMFKNSNSECFLSFFLFVCFFSILVPVLCFWIDAGSLFVNLMTCWHTVFAVNKCNTTWQSTLKTQTPRTSRAIAVDIAACLWRQVAPWWWSALTVKPRPLSKAEQDRGHLGNSKVAFPSVSCLFCVTLFLHTD